MQLGTPQPAAPAVPSSRSNSFAWFQEALEWYQRRQEPSDSRLRFGSWKDPIGVSQFSSRRSGAFVVLTRLCPYAPPAMWRGSRPATIRAAGHSHWPTGGGCTLTSSVGRQAQMLSPLPLHRKLTLQTKQAEVARPSAGERLSCGSTSSLYSSPCHHAKPSTQGIRNPVLAVAIAVPVARRGATVGRYGDRTDNFLIMSCPCSVLRG